MYFARAIVDDVPSGGYILRCLRKNLQAYASIVYRWIYMSRWSHKLITSLLRPKSLFIPGWVQAPTIQPVCLVPGRQQGGRGLHTVRLRGRQPRVLRVGVLEVYGSSPSSGERTLELPDPETLENAVDLEHTDSEDSRMAAAEDERLAAAGSDSVQCSFDKG